MQYSETWKWSKISFRYPGLFLRPHRLIPCLRHFGIKFYAYSPLAYVLLALMSLKMAHIRFYRGGLLVGKILDEDSMKNAKGGRWDPSVFPLAPALHERYAPMLPTLRTLKELLVRNGNIFYTKDSSFHCTRMRMISPCLKQLKDGCNTTAPYNPETQLFSVQQRQSKWRITLHNGASFAL